MIMDLKKVERYYKRALSSMYEDGSKPYHRSIACQIVDEVIAPLNLPTTAKILDLNSGVGYFLSEMKKRGYTDLLGIAGSVEEKSICLLDEHDVIVADNLFLADADSHYDLLFSRHTLERSPFPYFTLIEYNRVLKDDGILYVELSVPNDTRKHEYNPNYFSIMGDDMWRALFARSGFALISVKQIEVTISNSINGTKFPETYNMFLLQKKEAMV